MSENNPFFYTQRDTTYNFLTYRGVYFFRCGILKGYFTWPCTHISLKGNNLRKWYGSICFYFLYTDQMWRVEKMWYKKTFLILYDVFYSESYSTLVSFLIKQVRVLANICLFKFTKRNTRKCCKTCPRFTFIVFF